MENKNSISIVELALLAGGGYLAYKYLIEDKHTTPTAIPEPKKIQDHAAPTPVKHTEPVFNPAPIPAKKDIPTPEPVRDHAAPVKLPVLDLRKMITDVHDNILPAPVKKIIPEPKKIQDHAAPTPVRHTEPIFNPTSKAAKKVIPTPVPVRDHAAPVKLPVLDLRKMITDVHGKIFPDFNFKNF